MSGESHKSRLLGTGGGLKSDLELTHMKRGKEHEMQEGQVTKEVLTRWPRAVVWLAHQSCPKLEYG